MKKEVSTKTPRWDDANFYVDWYRRDRESVEELIEARERLYKTLSCPLKGSKLTKHTLLRMCKARRKENSAHIARLKSANGKYNTRINGMPWPICYYCEWPGKMENGEYPNFIEYISK